MCFRRRFYKSPISGIVAGGEERIIFHKGKICVKQLSIYYDGNNDTGTNKSAIKIKIDGEEIFNYSILDIYRYFSGYMYSKESTRPIVFYAFDDSAKIYSLVFHDLGPVNDGIEVWIKNEDTSNGCVVLSGMVYDVLE